jgi:hypothetical protein
MLSVSFSRPALSAKVHALRGCHPGSIFFFPFLIGFFSLLFFPSFFSFGVQFLVGFFGLLLLF